MLDIREIRSNAQQIEERLKRRDPKITLAPILELDKNRRDLMFEVETLQAERNKVSEEIGQFKREGKDAPQIIARMKDVSTKIKELNTRLQETTSQFDEQMLMLPNIPDEDVPASMNKEEFVIINEWGQKPQFDFEPKNHLELSEKLGLFDFERAAKISESQFPMYRGFGARLEWALINFMLDLQVNEFGFEMIIPPYLVNPATMTTSGNLPKFSEQLYKLRDDELYLIPTSEVPMGSIHRDEILDEKELPRKYTAFSPCFRREAGTYGAEERGLIRVHQFNKIEMFKYTTPETADEELKGLIANAEQIIERLGLHYRTTLLVTGDIAQQSAKTIDVEVWLPGQKSYYEVSSCSNCRTFQAVRGNIRYRPADGGKNRYVNTLNGSGLATSRLLISILETFQQPDGAILVPEVLRPYLGGTEVIGPTA
jgi:seryl-tRNA synthetase